MTTRKIEAVAPDAREAGLALLRGWDAGICMCHRRDCPDSGVFNRLLEDLRRAVES